MIMKNVLILMLLIGIFLTNSYAFGQASALPPPLGLHSWTAIVKVIGEDGNPIFGAGIFVQYNIPGKEGSGQPTYGEIKGSTDANGMFDTSHTDRSSGLAIIVEKSGYYTTHTGYQFYFSDTRQNPAFTLVLKKIGKPIPMYAKRIYKNSPVLNQPVGYDLMVGDWVGPYGKGINTDIIFTKVAYRKSGADYDYKVTIQFPKVGDGIQEFTAPDAAKGSGLLSPHVAPDNGYTNQLTRERYAYPGQPAKSDYNPNANYFFRVRTILDENGNVKSALYGKIYGEFMQYTYYLNPTPNDRNIEYDPKQDLLGRLSFDSQVRFP
jgi:hypothetical protein